MVLLGRIELPTSPLPRECSTSELQQRRALFSRMCNKCKCNLDPIILVGVENAVWQMWCIERQAIHIIRPWHDKVEVVSKA